MNFILNIFESRLRMLKHKFLGIRNHSLLKISVVGLMAVGLFAGTFYVPYRAFIFLESIGHLGVVIIDRLIYLLFMGLFMMLVFSNCIISFSTAYRSRETGFFLTLPLSYAQVYLVKFIDSILLSSWTFLCFLIPILSAYAVVRELGGTFYVSLLIFFIPFAIVSSAIGSLITMILVRFIPRKLYKFIGMLIGAFFVLGCIWLIFSGRAAAKSENEVVFLLTNFIPHFGFSQFTFAPNYWISEGIFKLISENFRESLFWWLMLMSNALFLGYLLFACSGCIFYDGWLKSISSHSKKIYVLGKSMVERICNKLSFLKPSFRAMVVKDIKVFLRDPVQWSQFTIFFGLLGIYFVNIRNLGYQNVLPFWKNIISFLNLTSTNLTLASLSVRFVFPQLSLEGKRFWILGLAPIEKKELLFEKFWLNSIAALCISLPLIITSNYMLDVSMQLMGLSVFLVILMCFSLISLCIGLGALFPNFREDNPAQIVSGFGGTLALVLCLVYITLNVSVLGLPFHLLVTERISQVYFDKLILFACGFVLTLSAVTIFGCLFCAYRALEKLEI